MTKRVLLPVSDDPHHRYRRAPLRRRILGSALSALVGWLTLNLVLISGTIYEGFRRIRPDPYEWEGCAVMSAFGLIFVLGTWLGLLVPLYLLVPLRSVLWRWPVCTLCGALAGALIMFGFYGFSLREPGAISTVALAAITGGATCLFGALTAFRFHDANHANVP